MPDQLAKRGPVAGQSLIDQLSVVVHSRSSISDVLPARKVPTAPDFGRARSGWGPIIPTEELLVNFPWRTILARTLRWRPAAPDGHYPCPLLARTPLLSHVRRQDAPLGTRQNETPNRRHADQQQGADRLGDRPAEIGR